MSETVSYIFTWHALSDACPKCQRLNGREYRGQDIFQDTLWDPFEGDIWDLNADKSLTHHHCRCQLEVRVEVDITKLPHYATLEDLMERLSPNG